MIKTLFPLTAALLSLSFAFPTASPALDDDAQAVHGAVEDYLLALYEAQPDLIERSVHKDLRKTGFGRWGDMQEYKSMPMTYEQLHKLAGTWNANGSKVTDESPRKIEVLDVLDKTACAKLTAQWGIDYFHLAKYGDSWKIINVLWQSHPPTKVAEGSYDK